MNNLSFYATLHISPLVNDCTFIKISRRSRATHFRVKVKLNHWLPHYSSGVSVGVQLRIRYVWKNYYEDNVSHPKGTVDIILISLTTRKTPVPGSVTKLCN